MRKSLEDMDMTDIYTHAYVLECEAAEDHQQRMILLDKLDLMRKALVLISGFNRETLSSLVAQLALVDADAITESKRLI